MGKIVELIPKWKCKHKSSKNIDYYKKHCESIFESLNVLSPLECDKENEDAMKLDTRKMNETNDYANNNDQKLRDD